MSYLPIGAIVLVIRLAMLAAEKSRGGGGDGSEKPPPPSSFTPAVGIVGLAAVLWVLLGPFVIVFFRKALAGELLFILPLLAILAVLLPWPFVRWVLVPLGLVKPAGYWMYLPSLAVIADTRGGAALASALALSRSRSPSAEQMSWLEDKIAKLAPLRGAGIVAQALLLHARGDRAAAERMFASVEHLQAVVVPPCALRVAREWRAAWFASRGEWERVADVCAAGGALSRATWLLNAIASHMSGLEERSPTFVWILWAIAPRRRATYAFVKEALERPFGIARAAEPKPLDVFLEEAGENVELALKLGAALLLRKPETIARTDLAELGSRWTRAISDPAFARALEARAIVIGAQRWMNVTAAIERELEEELSRMLRAAKIQLASGDDKEPASPLFERALRRLRSDVLGDIETAAASIKKREGAMDQLSPIAAWREFIELRSLVDDAFAIGGPEVERLAFPAIHSPTTSFAVHLFNQDKERAIANAMFVWLYEMAMRVGDRRGAEIQDKNVKCGAI